MTAAAELIQTAREQSAALRSLRFAPPVALVYDPLVYAREPFERYVDTYARRGICALFVGMNPGPFGMVQTGVPFGEVAAVRGFLGIEGRVDKPDAEHPRRPIEGFDCRRSEVSGKRLWGWAEQRFGTAQAFFERFFVWNWCPLAFLGETGKNLTPDKLPAAERVALERVCDVALAEAIRALAPHHLVGVGTFARTRLEKVAAAQGFDAPVGSIPHPSPASPAANRGWGPQVDAALAAMGLGPAPRAAR